MLLSCKPYEPSCHQAPGMDVLLTSVGTNILPDPATIKLALALLTLLSCHSLQSSLAYFYQYLGDVDVKGSSGTPSQAWFSRPSGDFLACDLIAIS